MDESTLKKLRLLPVVGALILAGTMWLWLGTPGQTRLIFATGSPEGLYHRLALQVKFVVEATHPDIIIDLQPSAGSRDNIANLDAGKAQLALVQNDAMGGDSVRSIAALYPEVLHLLCPADSPVHALKNLEGKRIGVGAAGSGTEQIVTNLLDFSGLHANTVRLPFSRSTDQLSEGKLDAAFFLTGLGAPAIRDALADGNIKLAPLHDGPPENVESYIEGFRVRYPHVGPRTIPVMTYTGQPAKPLPSLGVRAVIACHLEVDADVINRITRTLFEQRAVLSQKEPSFTHLDETAAQSALQFPLHEGAEYYYHRREPGFLITYAEPMAFLMSAMLLLWSIITWMRRWYLQNQKNRIDLYYQAVDDVIRRLHDGTNLEEIDELEDELLKIRQRASAELVKEKLAADESFIIYQNMLNGCQAMLVRMREKIKAPPIGDA